MTRRKVEVFLTDEQIEFCKKLGNGNRSEGIRKCVEYIQDNVESGLLDKEEV